MTVLADPPPDLRVLREELAELRRTHPRHSSVVAEAFQRLVRAADAVGQPLDGLRTHTRDEVERFFAQTIPGPDGHVYWGGPRRFRRNDGKDRVPRRWWWAHLHGREPGQYEDVIPTCGERNCINPEHCETGRDVRRRREFSDEQMLGALQVGALRLGHAPTKAEWDALGLRPSDSLYQLRFGSWSEALRLAGVQARHTPGIRTTPAACIAAIVHLRRLLGHWPNEGEFRRSWELLRAAGLVSAPGTIRKHLGPWSVALRKAGKR